MPSFHNQHNSFAQLSTPPYDRQNYFDSMLYYTPWQAAGPRGESDPHGNTYSERQPAYKPNPSAPMFQPKQLHTSTWVENFHNYTREAFAGGLPSIQSYHEGPQSFQPREQPKPKDEQSAGGLVKHLDYELQMMVDYLFEATLATYTPHLSVPRNQLPWSDFLDSVHKSSKSVATDYRDWLRHVLSATRLPSFTVFLALNYLAKRAETYEGRHLFRHETDVKRMFIVSLIIASKYADDSTFINRSWAEVAKIDIAIINHLELEWLQLIEWRLDVKVNPGWETYRVQFKRFELNRSFRNMNISTTLPRLNPLNTNLSSFSPPPASATTPTRNYAMSAYPSLSEQTSGTSAKRTKLYHESYSAAPISYDPWNPPRLASDLSPDSAPYTGPATPEFYPGPHGWSQPNITHAIRGVNAAPVTTYPQWMLMPQQQGTTQLPSFAQGYANTAGKYDGYNNVWNPSPDNHVHHNLSSCLYCPQSMNPMLGYNSQPVYT